MLGEENLVILRQWTRIYLEVKDLRVQINYLQQRQQGDGDSIGKPLGWERELEITGGSNENIWNRIGEGLSWNPTGHGGSVGGK